MAAAAQAVAQANASQQLFAGLAANAQPGLLGNAGLLGPNPLLAASLTGGVGANPGLALMMQQQKQLLLLQQQRLASLTGRPGASASLGLSGVAVGLTPGTQPESEAMKRVKTHWRPEYSLIYD